jgi:hypothetical protein
MTLKTGPALVNQFKPKVAHSFSSGVYLVVWQSHTQGNFQGDDIVGQLVGNTGNLIGTNFDIAVADSSFSHSNPEITYNRKMNEFLVVWQRTDKNETPNPIDDVYGKIVRPDGSIKPGLIEIARYSASSTYPSVASIPTVAAHGRYLVSWELNYAPGDRDIYARIVYGDGSAAPSDFKIFIGGRDQYGPAVAGNETSGEFLVIWHDAASAGFISPVIYGQTFDPDGIETGAAKNFGGFFTTNGALDSGALGDFMIVYNDTYVDPGGATREVFGHLWGNRIYLPLLGK